MDTNEQDTLIRSFDQIGAEDVNLVGGKGANLGEMTRAGLPVPPGFCVTANAYRTFLETTGLAERIDALIGQLSPADAAALDMQSGEIRRLFATPPVPDEIAAPVLTAYHRLDQLVRGPADAGAASVPAGDLLRVAIRSSATAEDLPTASFAGQQDTYLNVSGDNDLISHLRRCWASLWTARAVSYRLKQGFDHRKVSLCVVVQAMIPAETAGVLFTANPVSGSRDELVVNASWGLGEAIVSGLVTPDTIVLHKATGAVLSEQIAEKAQRIDYAPGGGTVQVEIAPDQRRQPALSGAQLTALAALARQVETHYGRPQDIEWAYAGDRFYLLQSRAITTLKEAAAAASATRGTYNRTMFRELFPDPLSPAFLSVIQRLFRHMLDFTFRAWGFEPPPWPDTQAVGAFYNQPYFNQDYIEAAFAPLSAPVRQQLVAQLVNPFGRHASTMPAELSPAYLRMVVQLLRFTTDFPKQLPGLVARYRSEVARFAALDVPALSESTLVAEIEELAYGSGSRFLNYDFLMMALIALTYQLLGTLLKSYFGDESYELRGRLISGVTGNVTMEANKHLWDLAQTAKRTPAVRAVLQNETEHDVLPHLEHTAEAQEFLRELADFLAEFGHREYKMDIIYPTWGEDPSMVLGFLRAYLDAEEKASPHQQQERLVRERQELIERVRGRLHNPAGRFIQWPLFAWVLQQAQTHTRERDTMHFELTRLFPPMRRMLLEVGRRWVDRGRLAQPDDIFFLTLDEIHAATETTEPLQETVAARRREYEASRRHPWPNLIKDGQEIWADAPGASAAKGDGGDRWVGVAGSPGRVTGAARIISGPEEFGKLQRGEILVAPLTNPVWTPLFAIAGGLVTEVGGILSHGAIVAREYGIPAVMGVPGVTRLVQDGQQLTVDGNLGEISR